MVRAALLACSIVASTAASAQQPPWAAPNPFYPSSNPLSGVKSAPKIAPTLAEIEKTPLVVYLAQGHDGACGRDCSEWIAVEGTFDRNAAARFRDFVTRLGRRNLSVFFNSPGGVQQQAEAIGAFMRQRGMTAGVAKTFPETCTTADSRTCELSKKSGKKLNSGWSSVGAQCSSACVYALLGARERLVPRGSYITIHSPRLVLCALTDGTILNHKDSRCIHLQNEQKARTIRYVRQMGGDPALVEAAYRVPHESFQILSRAQVLHFGVARNELNESPWMLMADERLIISFVDDLSDPGGVTRQAGAIALGCRKDGRVLFIYFRPGTDRDRSGDYIFLVNGNDKIKLTPAGSASFAQLDLDTVFHRYAVLLPPETVEARFHPKIEIHRIYSP